MRNHDYWVYIISNKTRSTLYVGVTDDLRRRIAQHRARSVPGFAHDYHCVDLMHSVHFRHIDDAIRREKQIKGWRRSKKNALIEETNPGWEDLAADWY
jgi:putative endonuclease